MKLIKILYIIMMFKTLLKHQSSNVEVAVALQFNQDVWKKCEAFIETSNIYPRDKSVEIHEGDSQRPLKIKWYPEQFFSFLTFLVFELSEQ